MPSIAVPATAPTATPPLDARGNRSSVTLVPSIVGPAKVRLRMWAPAANVVAADPSRDVPAVPRLALATPVTTHVATRTYNTVDTTMPAASADGSSPGSSPGIAGSIDHASGVGNPPPFLSSTHRAASAVRAIDTCLLPAVGDSSDATVVLPYAADVMACACDTVTPTEVIAFSAPAPPPTLRCGASAAIRDPVQVLD
jgi:hypothetical protein